MPDYKFKYGVPTKSDYNQLLSTDLFNKIQQYSDEFLKEADSELEYYNKKWVLDPLHQWSRQYEYPYVFSDIAGTLPEKKMTILDAGSGMTFFPFYLKKTFPEIEVFCCDYDENLGQLYLNISKKLDIEISFNNADIRKLPYAANTFDIVYCISVLEHTDNFELVLDELQRVTKPGGKLILTFDIALDNFSDISIDKAEKLLKNIKERFSAEASPIDLSNAENITTNDFKNTDLLPWKYNVKQSIKNILNGKSPLRRHHLTFYCLSSQKAQ